MDNIGEIEIKSITPGYTAEVKMLRASLPEGPASVARPVLVVVSGLPGSGKSYFSRRLVERMPLLILESDALRKVLFPTPSYDRAESARLFEACYSLIDELLVRGVPILLDATNLIEGHRERLYNIAHRRDAKLVLVHVKASPEIVYERLKGRSEGVDPQDHSSATWQVYGRLYSTAEPIKRNHFVVDSSRDINPAIEKVAGEVRRWTGTLG